MRTDTRAAVENFNKKQIPFLYPLYESITNSLEANATEITVDFDTFTQVTNPNDIRINGFTVTDNGTGFNEANIKSFHTVWSKHKKDLGCKGVGRFTWLVVFEYIQIKSHLKEKDILINFHIDYEETVDLLRSGATNDKVETIVSFKNPTSTYVSTGRDRRASADIDEIKDSIHNHLYYKLFLLKQKGVSFNIKLKINSDERVISESNLQEPESTDFTINHNTENYRFTIFYLKLELKAPNKFYYCANGRIVKEFRSGVISKNLNEDNACLIAFLVSDYLDDVVGDARTDFNIAEYQLPLTDIDDYFDNKLGEILFSFYPNLELDNQEVIDEAIEENPHLAEFIRSDPSTIKRKDKLVKNARKKFETKKDTVRAKFKQILNNAEIKHDEFEKVLNDVTHLQSLELASYIAYRQQVIEGFKRLISINEPIEKYLHNIFMQKQTDSTDSETIYSNNIWLLDDKFMSYAYAASDRTINQITEQIQERYAEKYKVANRPDMVLFYSKDENASRDAVLIEFKGIDASFDEKNKSLTELPNNIDLIKSNIPNIKRVWAYIITGIDNDFARSIRNQARYKALFTNGDDEKIYYDYFEDHEAHVYIVDVNAIAIDAETRNKVFLDLITKEK